MRAIPAILLLLELQGMFAQLPDTDIWLLRMKTAKNGSVTLSDARNITSRDGYDNQPSFSADEKRIYYSSVRSDSQADVYAYEIKSRKIKQLTFSAESEYSPATSSTYSLCSAVIVDKDSAQRLLLFDPLTGRHVRKYDFDSVGYYCFLNRDTIAYFKTGKPHSLRVRDLSGTFDAWIADDPIRGFRKMNRHTFVYGVHESSRVQIFRYDLLLRKGERFATAPPETEDVVIHPEYGLLRPEGGKIFRYDARKEDWTELFDLTPHGIVKITRFAFSGGGRYLAVVNQR
jgi:hypothetical protein